MKISKSFIIYIHIILVFLISKNLLAAEDFSKNIVIHEKPLIIKELKFKDFNLQDVDLTNKKGNIMIINFWASWCLPCKREMPSLAKLAEKYPNIEVYAINMEKPNKLRTGDFFKNLGITSLDIYFDTDFKLVIELSRFDPVTDKTYVFELEEGTLFSIPDGREFKLGKKRVKRFECEEISTRKKYIFSPHAEVIEIKKRS